MVNSCKVSCYRYKCTYNKRLCNYGQTSQSGHREQDNHPHQRRASLRLHEDFFYQGSDEARWIGSAKVNGIPLHIQTPCPELEITQELRQEGFDDPVVYKYAHCQCTITYPGTSIITESGKLIPSWSRQENIINLRSGEIKFVGKIHGAVGWEYEIIYPHESFI